MRLNELKYNKHRLDGHSKNTEANDKAKILTQKENNSV